jgi:hypothetical protein
LEDAKMVAWNQVMKAMTVIVFFRWYAVEYNWFYLDSSSNSYTFHTTTSPSGGDMTDAINYGDSFTNGSPFRASASAYCVGVFGPWWYVQPGSCAFVVLFGSPIYWKGLTNGGRGLQAVRMMIRPYDA